MRPIQIASDFFETDLRPPGWPDDEDLRKALDWLTSYIPAGDWRTRRFQALERFINSAAGGHVDESAGTGRFFSAVDQIGWYLFLGQAKLDHPTVYDFMYGSRVLPVLWAIGRNVEALRRVAGVEDRVLRLVGDERAQPNGGLFELLVAAAYLREGAEVSFLPEQRGKKKTHDLDVSVGGTTWAVECKRLELGEYTERERAIARQLWLPTAHSLQRRGLNVLAQVQFSQELNQVPPQYLAHHADRWLSGGAIAPHSWTDQFASGAIRLLDLKPLSEVLRTDDVALHSSRMHQLLTGRYKRNAKIIQALHVKAADNPLYISECDQAVVLDWESRSPDAIDGKARDVLKRLSDGVRQLPDGRPGVVHLGLEAVDGLDVEATRYEKILRTLATFDPGDKPLEYTYVNWFAPESPPDASESFDETCHWSGRKGGNQRPLNNGLLLFPPGGESREGVHWEPEQAPRSS